MGLDKPVPVQYLIWAWDALRGDFGKTNRSGRPVIEMMQGRLMATLELAAASLVMSLVFIPLGILAATKPRSLLDNTIMTFCTAGVAVPGIWLGLLLILVFSVKLGWLPPGGYVALSEDAGESLKRVIMPASTLAVQLVAAFTRFLRADMIEVLNEDYIRTAHAKGLREWIVLFRHAMPNAFIPLLTIMGMWIGSLLGGAVIMEQVFGWSGIGWLTLQGVYNRDYPLVQAAVLLIAVFKSFMNYLVDIGYAFVNPRIGEQYSA
jgi:peptide/nickel transport system permease protein